MKKNTVLMIFIVIAPSAAWADLSMVYPQQSQCQTELSGIQLSGSRMRMDSVMEGRNYTMLFDGLEDIITSLDHSNHNYHQMEVDEDALDFNTDVMSSTGNFIGNQMKTVQAQMQKQCEQMEKQGMSCGNMMDMTSMMQSAQAMAAGKIPKIEIKPSDKAQTVSGMVCKTYDRYENGRKSSEECYVETKDMAMPEKDKKYLLRNMKVMQHFAKSMTGLTDKLMPEMNKASGQADPANSGFLLSQVCFTADGNEQGRIEVQISNAAIDAGSFEIPPGYQLMKLRED